MEKICGVKMIKYFDFPLTTATFFDYFHWQQYPESTFSWTCDVFSLPSVNRVSARRGPLWWSTMMPVRSGCPSSLDSRASAASTFTTTLPTTPLEWWASSCRTSRWVRPGDSQYHNSVLRCQKIASITILLMRGFSDFAVQLFVYKIYGTVN